MLRDERRSGETLRICPHTASSSATSDPVPANTATTATADIHNDETTGDSNPNGYATDSATSTFANAVTHAADNLDSAQN